MNWKSKKSKRKITFYWADGEPDLMTVPQGLVGAVVKMLYEDNRIYAILVDGLQYADFVRQRGGLIIPAAEKEWEAQNEQI